MKFNRPRSITVPIVLGASSVALSIALLVGWILVLIQNSELAEQAARANAWLMAAGIGSFAVIVVVLVLFSVFLVREIIEGQRQVRFIDSVTHELKSPLASLKLSVQTLDRQRISEPQRADLRRRMLVDIDRLNTFIDDILSASRLSSITALDLQTVDLGHLVRRAAERVQKRYSLDDGRITINIDDGIQIQTSETALETVMKNLLDNAVKYSHPPVSVVVLAEVRRKRVFISVIDQGIGIPRAHIRRIFDRFYRVPIEGVHARRGTGLGLYVVHALVRTLGGRLRADSPGEDQGTTMRFDLPIRPTGEP
jgi:signal transduction histidine kinase